MMAEKKTEEEKGKGRELCLQELVASGAVVANALLVTKRIAEHDFQVHATPLPLRPGRPHSAITTRSNTLGFLRILSKKKNDDA